jgi:hypothetical protein
MFLLGERKVGILNEKVIQRLEIRIKFGKNSFDWLTFQYISNIFLVLFMNLY